MEVYLFQAALCCGSCAGAVKDSLRSTPIDGDPILMADSGYYPQGPYWDGGGEADAPQCCDSCRTFLENPLTPEGYEYVREKIADATGDPDVLAEWREFYDIEEEEE